MIYVAEVNASKTNGSIAQLGEHLPYKQEVTGSSPVVPTNNLALWCSRLARQPVTLEVDGSSPFGGAINASVESDSSPQYASVAQSVEQWTENPRVVGSIPTGGTTVPLRNRDAGVAHPVERHLAKVEVASSSLVTRSKRIRNALRS